MREEVGWNGNVLDVEREDEEERQISQSNRIDDTYQGLHHQVYSFLFIIYSFLFYLYNH